MSKKYFVVSGELELVVFANDLEGAALGLMNEVMEMFFPHHRTDEIGSDPFEYLEDGLMLLGEEIFVSEKEFGGEDACLFDTIEIFSHWNELVIAVAKMEESLLGDPLDKLVLN